MTTNELRTELFRQITPLLDDEILMLKLLAVISSLKQEAPNQVKVLTREERKKRFLRLAGAWSEDEEGEEMYHMMVHRNEGRTANRDIHSFD